MGKLVFMNADANPHNVSIDVHRDSVPHVMNWYGLCRGQIYCVI